MVEDFFDESILKVQNEDNFEFSCLKNYDEFRYNLRKFENKYQIFCEINNERLNSSELKALLKLNETKNFLSQEDISLINYLLHRLLGTLSIYTIINDLGLIINYLRGSFRPIFYNDEPLDVGNDYKLDIDLTFDENNNISLDIENEGEFIYGVDKAYFITENVLYPLFENIPAKFYKEIFEGKNKFSIESFFSLKNTLLKSLREFHNVKVSKEIEELESLKVVKKVAPIVALISKTSHFVVVHLKYKIANEFYDVENYKYADTINWMDKSNEIRIVKENDSGLIHYTSDLSISDDIFRDIFDGLKIRYSVNQKSPFMLMLPISSLEVFVNLGIPILEKHFQIEYKDGIKLKLIDGNVKFEIETNLKSRLDLFEFKVKFKIADEYFDLDFLKELMLSSKKYVQLKDGSTVNIENIREINKWIEFLKKYEFKKNEDLYKTQSKSALELDEFLKYFKDKEVKSNEEYRNIIQELKEKKPVIQINLPPIVENILRDYQKEGVYWMNFLKKYGFGGILADEMGLGKTIQSLTVLAMNKNNNSIHIVICPKTLIYNWENEIKKYFPEMKSLVINGDVDKRKELIGTAKNYDVLITSYSMIQKDYKFYTGEQINFDYAVLDEAHYVKNIKTLSAKAVRLISAKNRILLTGTPLENNLDELYGTFDLIMPGYLGSKLEYSRDFASKIERNNMIALEILQAKIRPFILRRTKSQVLKELPDKQEQVVYSQMTNKQIGIYQEILNRVKFELNNLIEKQGFERSRIQVLSALLKLRQVCNHPYLVDSQFGLEKDMSGKYEQFKELVLEVIGSGEKALVFSQFTSMLDIFEKDLTNMGIKLLRLDGKTKNRQELVDQFNDDDSVKIFLISLKAGGVGLNLTSASSVFLYDPWWNPMVEKQAMDRAHRIGQTKTVHVYKFITKDSIEEKILKLQERKGNLFENLVQEESGFMKRLEWEDLMGLFD